MQYAISARLPYAIVAT